MLLTLVFILSSCANQTIPTNKLPPENQISDTSSISSSEQETTYNQLLSESEPDKMPDISPNPLKANLEKVVAQTKDPQFNSVFRVLEQEEADLFDVADEISGAILRSLVREEHGIVLEHEYIDGSKYIAIVESGENIEFEDGRYYQATASSPLSTWIRLYYSNFSPKGTPAGGNPPSHKDIVVWIDQANEADALLAWQSIETPSLWTIYRLPNFGGWLKIELMMHAR